MPWEMAVASVNALNVDPDCRRAATGKLNCWLLLYGTEESIASTSPVRGSMATIAAAGASAQLMLSVSAWCAAFCSFLSSDVWTARPPLRTVCAGQRLASTSRTYEMK